MWPTLNRILKFGAGTVGDDIARMVEPNYGSIGIIWFILNIGIGEQINIQVDEYRVVRRNGEIIIKIYGDVLGDNLGILPNDNRLLAQFNRDKQILTVYTGQNYINYNVLDYDVALDNWVDSFFSNDKENFLP